MARWAEVASSAPDFATAVREVFDAHRHKTLATVRRDGSPRISGIEASFIDGELWLGMMGGSRKALDLRRDPRFAVHSATVDPELTKGDAKIAGRVEEITDPATMTAVFTAEGRDEPPGPSHLFRADVTEVVLTRIGEPADHLVIEVWRPGQGVERIERR